MTLRIGMSGKTAVTLPLEAVTQTFGIVAVRGAGKTNTAVVMTEELIGAGSQVVVLDPLDVWWGLRASADGKGAGLPAYVFGGEHADLPLDAAAGKLIADVVVEQGINAVVSMRHLSKGAQRRFVADFAEQLYHRKGAGKYQTPLHVVIDEADAFAPQRVMADTARMLGAIDDLVRRGRNAGFGVTLITQRPATLNKDVLAMVEALVVLRTISPQDRKALDAWIVAHDSEGHRQEFMASLAGLQRGEAWLWSPGWLDVFQRVQIRQRTTYDSSATPKAGEKRTEPKRLAPVDIDALRERMASVVEQAEANDPKKLQARIAQLERELKAQPATSSPADCGHAGTIAGLEASLLESAEYIDELRRDLRDARACLAGIATTSAEILKGQRVDVARMPSRPVNRTNAAPVAKAANVTSVTSRPRPTPARVDGDARLSGPQQKILDTLAELLAIGIAQPARTIVAALVGYHARTKAFINGLGTLRTSGYVEYPTAGALQISDQGLALAQPASAPLTRTELHERVKQQLSGPQQRVLDELIGAYPESLERTDLAQRVEYHERTKAFINGLGKMRSMGIIDYPAAGRVVATELLFPAGVR